MTKPKKLTFKRWLIKLLIADIVEVFEEDVVPALQKKINSGAKNVDKGIDKKIKSFFTVKNITKLVSGK